jgi:hypothetical protein
MGIFCIGSGSLWIPPQAEVVQNREAILQSIENIRLGL